MRCTRFMVQLVNCLTYTALTARMMAMSRKKKVAFTIVAIVLFLFVVEITLRIVDQHNTFQAEEKRRAFEPYQGKPWADQYFKDETECDRQTAKKNPPKFVLYLLHDVRDDCVTEYYNYANGVRKTWNPASSTITKDEKVYTVGMFGGSTLLGLGAIDNETIPSHFSHLLNASSSGKAYLITNYGVSSYTFTQSLMKLILLLREGRRFNYVVFYDGTNDMDNAYEANEVGALISEKALRLVIEGTTSDHIREFVKTQLESCKICKAVVLIARNTPYLKDHLSPLLLKIRGAIQFKKGQKNDDAATAKLAQGIADYYEKSHSLLDALARAYDFKYIEFWQPALLYEDSLVGGEKILLNVDPRLTDEKLKTLYRLTRDDMDKKHLTHFYNISDVLIGRPKAYYLDEVHVSGDGNQVIAEKILDFARISLFQ